MQIHEERLVERMWLKFSMGKTITNAVCSDFFFSTIRAQRSLGHLNAFEVLDIIVNCPLPIDHAHKKPPQNEPLPTIEVTHIELADVELPTGSTQPFPSTQSTRTAQSTRSTEEEPA